MTSILFKIATGRPCDDAMRGGSVGASSAAYRACADVMKKMEAEGYFTRVRRDELRRMKPYVPRVGDLSDEMRALEDQMRTNVDEHVAMIDAWVRRERGER